MRRAAGVSGRRRAAGAVLAPWSSPVQAGDVLPLLQSLGESSILSKVFKRPL